MVWLNLYWSIYSKLLYISECASERILNIDQYLVQLRVKKLGVLLFAPLCITQFENALKSTRLHEIIIKHAHHERACGDFILKSTPSPNRRAHYRGLGILSQTPGQTHGFNGISFIPIILYNVK